MEQRNFFRTMAAGIGIAMGSTALVGCAHYEHVDTAEPATIIQHDYHPPYTSFIIISNGRGGTTLIPVYHPEKFGLELRQCDKPKAENVDTQGCVTEEVTVTKDQYNQLNDGDTVTLEHK